jgi:hypothetical protein
MINKNIVTPNLVAAAFHRVSEIQAVPPFAYARVSVVSYTDEAAYLAGAGLVYVTPLMVPIDMVNGSLLATVEDWIIGNEASPFEGGTVAIDKLDTLDNARDRAWDKFKRIRDAKEAEPFEHNGRVYDANKISVTGAALAAFMAVSAQAPYSINFTLADNSVVVLDGPEMMAVGIALLQHIDNAHQLGRQVRELIYAPETDTFDKIAAITWPA